MQLRYWPQGFPGCCEAAKGCSNFTEAVQHFVNYIDIICAGCALKPKKKELKGNHTHQGYVLTVPTILDSAVQCFACNRKYHEVPNSCLLQTHCKGCQPAQLSFLLYVRSRRAALTSQTTIETSLNGQCAALYAT